MKCATHPDTETNLKCGKCGKPICPKCMVQTPVGARCRECARVKKLPTFTVSGSYYLRGIGAALGMGIVMGLAWGAIDAIMPFFYLGSYKIGNLILGNSVPFDEKYISIPELLKLGLNVTIASVSGGLVLGILPGIATYFITRKIMQKLRSRKKSIPNNFCNSPF